jgi:hypothetical protein
VLAVLVVQRQQAELLVAILFTEWLLQAVVQVLHMAQLKQQQD